MSGAKRCDEILRLIDDVLRDATIAPPTPPPTAGGDETDVAIAALRARHRREIGVGTAA